MAKLKLTDEWWTCPAEADNGKLIMVTGRRDMEEVQDALQADFMKDPVAVLTGIYTGNGERNWVFYTRSLTIFGRKLNEDLAKFELLPLEFYAESDPEWNEYREMREETEIKD